MASRESIIASLYGTTIVIPDIETALGDWPRGNSSSEEKLRVDIGRRLEAVLGPVSRLEKVKAARVETFVATWWPHAAYERMRVAAYLLAWLFIWDDETDTPEYTTELVSDMHAGQRFRGDTLSFVRQCLDPNIRADKRTRPSNGLIASFDAFGDLAVATFKDGQRRILLDQLEVWVKATGIEQWRELTGTLPDVDNYLKERMGSSAVGVCLAICEYMLDIDLPDHVRQEPDFKLVWYHTNIIISIVNDMLSFKKELRHSRLDNILVLLYIQHGSMEAAMGGAFERVLASKDLLDQAGERVIMKYGNRGDEKTGEDLRNFVDCCKTMCTGNNAWSLRSERYGLGVDSFEGGVMVEL